MKRLHKLLLVVLMFTTIYAASAQKKLPEYSFQPNAGGSSLKVISGTDGWLAISNSGECGDDQIIYVNKNTGSVKIFNLPSSYIIYDIIQSAPNRFICSGVDGKGNDVASADKSLMFSIDSNGHILDNNAINNLFNPDYHELLRVVSGSDGSVYALSSDNYLIKANAKFRNIWKKQYKGASDLLWSANGLLVAIGGNIIILDTAGSTVKTVHVNGISFRSLFNAPGGFICASEPGHVYLLDTGYNVIHSMAYSGTMGVAGDNAFYFYNKDSLASVDFNGKTNWKSALPEGNMISGLAFDGNQLAVTGNGKVGFIKIFSKDGITASIKRDIGVMGITAKNIVYKNTYNTSGAPNYKDITADLDVTVKNFGTETIDSFYIESLGNYRGQSYSCSEVASAGFFKVNLAPGDTKTVPLSVKRILVMPYAGKLTLDVSVNTLSPNAKLDGDMTNDAFHYSNVVAGIKEDQIAKQNIHLFPNPTSGLLTINIDGASNMTINATVLTTTGQELIRFDNVKEHFEIDLSGLAPGMYLVKIQNEAGSYVEKLVKE